MEGISRGRKGTLAYIRGRELWIAIVRFWVAMDVRGNPTQSATEMKMMLWWGPALAGNPPLGAANPAGEGLIGF
jgi:hypothetical protein